MAVVFLLGAFLLDSEFEGAVILQKLSDWRYVWSQCFHALTLGLTVLVVAVPEGLPMMIAVVLSANIRRMAREIVGGEDFLEVFVSTPIEECERRDVKGLYARARRGEVKDFTGVSAPFEAPLSPDLDIDTSVLSLQESVDKVLQLILAKSKL